MTNEEIKLTIENLSQKRKLAESFLLPLLTGMVVAGVSKGFLDNIAYICLCSLGLVALFILAWEIIRLNKKINSLIKQIV